MIADRVKEFSTTTGTGALTLSGAVTGFESFNTAFGIGPSFDYCIESVDAATGAPNGSWEIGSGHLSGATTLVRDTVQQSSNADALVAFGPGTKNVFCTLPASVVIALQAAIATKVAKAGDTMTGPLLMKAAAVAPEIKFQDNAATNKMTLYWEPSDNSCRWQHSDSTTLVVVSSAGDVQTWTGVNTNFYLAGSSGDMSIRGANAYKAGGGSWTASSDIRIKDVIGDYTHGLAEVLQLLPVRYVYKGNYARTGEGESAHRQLAENKKEFVGLIAQQAEVSMPEMVTMEAGYIDGEPVDDLRLLDTTALMFALVNACKELAARVAALESVTSGG